MKIAIIDMGTNTFHLMLTEVTSSKYEIFHKERVAVKIGEKGINKGQIKPDAWDRAITTLIDFKKKVDDRGITKIFATATSAIRNASNGEELSNEIEKQTGIEIEIISGEKEANLILLGVRKALHLGKEKNLIMDIGGGSIEFILANNEHTFWLKSFEIGGQRLVEKFHHHDPIISDEISNLHAYFKSELEDLSEQCKLHKPQTLIGCAGTFDTLSDIYCATINKTNDQFQSEYPLPLDAFTDIFEDLLKKSRNERLAIPGMIEMRVDMIVVACLLVDYIIQTMNIKNLRVSAYALKEGVLFDSIESVRKLLAPN
jgi:exopolyphosphatase/guanosine-5'-triphosphate,3'-diphosphate pyrophosphatase